MSIQIVEVESSSLSGISSIDVEYGSNNIAIVEVRQGPAGDDATVTTAAVRAAVPNLVEVATPANDDMIQRIGGSWVARTIAQVRTALGLGSAAYADTGTGASNVILGNDARLTDARTPTAHASSHVTGGTDKIRDASASQDGLMTTAYASKLNGIEAGADVTDATNVAAAGAVMESDYTPSHSLLVQQSGTGSPSSLQVGNNTLVGRLSGGGSDIDDLSASQVRTLLNVEDGADVTDAANVASTITGATEETTPVDGDFLPMTKTASSGALRKVTFANMFAYALTKLQAAASIVFTGQLRSTAQTAATADALITRALLEWEHSENAFMPLSLIAASGTANSFGATTGIQAVLQVNAAGVAGNYRITSTPSNPLLRGGFGTNVRLNGAEWSILIDMYINQYSNNEARFLFGAAATTTTDIAAAAAGLGVVWTSATSAKLQINNGSLTESSSLTTSESTGRLNRWLITWKDDTLRLYQKSWAETDPSPRWSLIGSLTGTGLPNTCGGNNINFLMIATGSMVFNSSINLNCAQYLPKAIAP